MLLNLFSFSFHSGQNEGKEVEGDQTDASNYVEYPIDVWFLIR